MFLIKTALKKSCDHQMKLSLRNVSERFSGAGYHAELVHRVLKTVCIVKTETERIPEDRSNLAVLPFIRVSHNIKAVA